MTDSILDKYEAEFKAGDIIFCEYERGDEFYIVKEGKVRIAKIQDGKKGPQTEDLRLQMQKVMTEKKKWWKVSMILSRKMTEIVKMWLG